MERQRYEVTLRCGSSDAVMWTNRLEELEPVLRLAISGSQSSWRMACHVRDTVVGSYAEVSAKTPVGFTEAVQHLLAAVTKTETRPLSSGEGRDVVVEIGFAAHDATLEQCKKFVGEMMDEALLRLQPATGPSFSFNGQGVQNAWFE